MFLLIERGHALEVCRPLAPNESIDLTHHAERYGRAIGYRLDTDNPTHAGIGADVDVTIQRTKKPGAAVVWSSKGFYFADGETE